MGDEGQNGWRSKGRKRRGRVDGEGIYVKEGWEMALHLPSTKHRKGGEVEERRWKEEGREKREMKERKGGDVKEGGRRWKIERVERKRKEDER